MCVVEERHTRLEAGGVEMVDEAGVAPEGLVVETAITRLHAAPGDREAEGVGTGVARQSGIRLITLPRPHRPPACFAAGPAGSLPLRPVAGVVAFDLVMRHSRAPQPRPVG